MSAIQTHVFKAVGDCAIKADVHGAGPAARPRPVAMWIHGGALIEGGRAGIDADLLRRLLAEDLIVVSIDYRLAPETKLPEIIEDVGDAYRWVRRAGPDLFGADGDRIAVLGESAGGYLTLMTGFCVRPRPRVLVSLYGYGDIAGDWYARPDPFYCRQPAVTRDQARAAVGGGELSEPPAGHQRGRFYLYCRQHGLWPKEVTGLDPHAQRGALDPYCPARNVTPDWPATLLIHGERDTDVPHAQSVLMAAELARAGAVNELITLKNAGHCLAGADPADLACAHDRIIAFVSRHLRRPVE